MSKHREFSCAIVVDTKDRLLFQHRDDIPGILLPGMICLFGGHREGDESFEECVARELCEELSYFIPAERITRLGGHRGVDLDRGFGTADCDFFLVRGVPADEVSVTEGSLLIVDQRNWTLLGGRLAPFAKVALELFTARETVR
jgi:8-oxo-dGTP pyrophosphatase MutT (NUDIX family)